MSKRLKLLGQSPGWHLFPSPRKELLPLRTGADMLISAATSKRGTDELGLALKQALRNAQARAQKGTRPHVRAWKAAGWAVLICMQWLPAASGEGSAFFSIHVFVVPAK